MADQGRLGGARAAVAFLTPLGGAAEPGPGTVWWFPAVGLALGLAVGGLWWGAGRLWPPALAAIVAVAADLGLTGLLHVDGLCDAADGLLAHVERPRRLQIMSTPDVGAFGVTVVGVVLLSRWAALASLKPSPWLIGALWSASRTWMAATVLGVPYARSSGLATAFLPDRRGRALGPVAVLGLGTALLLSLAWRPVAGPLAVAAGTLAAGGVVCLARRRLGGFTGDVLGAAGLVGETVGLLVAAAKW